MAEHRAFDAHGTVVCHGESPYGTEILTDAGPRALYLNPSTR
jgi:hypothetical protein